MGDAGRGSGIRIVVGSNEFWQDSIPSSAASTLLGNMEAASDEYDEQDHAHRDDRIGQ